MFYLHQWHFVLCHRRYRLYSLFHVRSGQKRHGTLHGYEQHRLLRLRPRHRLRGVVDHHRRVHVLRTLYVR